MERAQTQGSEGERSTWSHPVPSGSGRPEVRTHAPIVTPQHPLFFFHFYNTGFPSRFGRSFSDATPTIDLCSPGGGRARRCRASPDSWSAGDTARAGTRRV